MTCSPASFPAGVPLMFGIDATTYPRPNAECSPDRGLHYAPCRCDGDRKVVPGWQFQWVMGLEWGTSSWTLPVDARRLPEGACPVTATAGQIRDLAGRLGRRQEPAGRPAPLFILDQGYAAAALTHALDGLEVQLLVRIAGDRVFYDGRPGPRKPGPGRNGVHGQRFELAAGADQRPADQLLVVPDTSRYGRVEVRAWHGMHQKVQRTGYFARLEAELFTRLPVIEGTIIEVRVERLPDGRSPHRTMWLWHSGPHAPDLDVCWRAYLRRFDMEHTFKLMKSQLGWTAARVRHPEQAGALDLAADRRLRPAPPRPRPGSRPAPPLGTTTPPRTALDALPGPRGHFVTCVTGWAPRPICRKPPTPAPAPARRQEHPSPAPPPRIRTSQNGRAQEDGRQEEGLNLKLGDALRERGFRHGAAQVISEALTGLEPFLSVKAACALLGKPRATLYRQRNPPSGAGNASRTGAAHPAALSAR